MLYWQSLGFGVKKFSTDDINRFGDYFERSELNLRNTKTPADKFGVRLNELLRAVSSYTVSDENLARNTALVKVVINGPTIEGRIEGYFRDVFTDSNSNMLVTKETGDVKCEKFGVHSLRYKSQLQDLLTVYDKYRTSKNLEHDSSPRSENSHFEYNDDLEIMKRMTDQLQGSQLVLGYLNSLCLKKAVQAEENAAARQKKESEKKQMNSAQFNLIGMFKSFLKRTRGKSNTKNTR